MTSTSFSDYYDSTGEKVGDVLLSRFKILTGGSTGTMAIATKSDAGEYNKPQNVPQNFDAQWRRIQFRSVK